jgi:hypothetical protein
MGSGPRAARCPRLGLAWLLQEHGPRLGMFSFQKIREYIRSIKHRFIIKLITGWTENHEMNPLNLINLSLEILYSITIFSNHDIIRLTRFFSRFETKIMK